MDDKLETMFAMQQELNRRTMEIYKQQGITPILGCLPMMLQMPIWIGLYTAVNMEVALRHQGLFPASWHWITDLSAPDRLIPFEWFGIDPIAVPLVGTVDAGPFFVDKGGSIGLWFNRPKKVNPIIDDFAGQ